jgi:pSer/pThr/pTyr-binding forkhead associated (FHA) protein
MTARLEVTDALGSRVVPIGKPMFGIGRRETNDLRLAGSEVSRDHADIITEGDNVLIRDKNSRYGTYVNGEQVTERALSHGDRVRLGRTGGAEMIFMVEGAGTVAERSATCVRSRPCSKAFAPSVPVASSTTCCRWCSTRPSK